MLEVRGLLKTSHPLLSQKLEEPLDSKQEGIGTHLFYKTLFEYTLVSSCTEMHELLDKMKTLEDLTSTVQKREGII